MARRVSGAARAIVPATICMATPTTHPAMIMPIQVKCGSWRSTITPDGSKGRERGEKGADRAEQLRRVDPADPAVVRGRIVSDRRLEGQRRGIDPEIEADGAAQHHQQQEGLVGEGGVARSHQCSHKQPARRACHGKPKALKDVGELFERGFSWAGPRSMPLKTRTVLEDVKAT